MADRVAAGAVRTPFGICRAAGAVAMLVATIAAGVFAQAPARLAVIAAAD